MGVGTKGVIVGRTITLVTVIVGSGEGEGLLFKAACSPIEANKLTKKRPIADKKIPFLILGLCQFTIIPIKKVFHIAVVAQIISDWNNQAPINPPPIDATNDPMNQPRTRITVFLIDGFTSSSFVFNSNSPLEELDLASDLRITVPQTGQYKAAGGKVFLHCGHFDRLEAL